MIRHSCFVVSCAAFVACFSAHTFANKRSNDREVESAKPVELFEAIQSKTVEATVIPRDSTRVTIQLANKTDKPIALIMPEALAAAPVLAQFGPPLNGFPNNQNPGGNNNAPQVLGMPGIGQNGGNLGQNQGNPGGFPAGFFNIPPGRVIKKRIPAVCLEFGKPDPRPLISYELRPLDSFSSDVRLESLLVEFGKQKSDNQRAFQLAAWHIANGKSWDDLASLSVKHVTGAVSRRFSRAEIELAKKVVDGLPKSKKSEYTRPTESLTQK